jgi:UPF0755 protein
MKKKAGMLIGICILMILWIPAWIIFSPVVNSDMQSYRFKVRPGTSFNGILNLLLAEKLIDDGFKINTTAKIFGLKTKLKAGKYEIPAAVSSYRLLKILSTGKVSSEKVTIREGLQSRQIAAILAKEIEIDSTQFMSLVYDGYFAESLDIEAGSLEGFLFPNTYYFVWGMDEKSVIKHMVGEFNRQFNDTLRQRLRASKYSLIEILTLASIVEGEAVLDSERETIAAVYHNRLKKRMPLQADPTIQYIIADGPRRLLKRDLQIDSPYNTYKYRGLPPGPINNPGIRSLAACLNPAKVDYLYFVARGDGSHIFSRTLNEHLRAKAEFDKYRRAIRRQRKANNG